MIPISICAIARNEEKNIVPFLTAIRTYTQGFSVELIVVDTGSTDKTCELAAPLADKLLHFTWCDDFSAARNYTIAQASYDYILFLDCDEMVTSFDMPRIQSFLQQYPDDIGMISRHNQFKMNNTDSFYTDQVERLFPKEKFHYEAPVHEQVCSTTGFSFRRIELPLEVRHNGYNGTTEELQQKALRNNALLEKMLLVSPDNPYLYFQLGQSYNMLHDDEKALFYYDKGLSFDVNPAEKYVQMMVCAYGYALLHLGKNEEALALTGVYDTFAVSADFVTLIGLIYLRNEQYMKALGEFVKALSYEKADTEGANSFIPHFNIGYINELFGEKDAAITQYKCCGDFKPALERLSELEQK